MTNELKLYRAVTSCRHLLRQGRAAASAARIAANEHGLDTIEETKIRLFAMAAEVALEQWRDSNPQATTTRKDKS